MGPTEGKVNRRLRLAEDFALVALLWLVNEEHTVCCGGTSPPSGAARPAVAAAQVS